MFLFQHCRYESLTSLQHNSLQHGALDMEPPQASFIREQEQTIVANRINMLGRHLLSLSHVYVNTILILTNLKAPPFSVCL